MILLLFLPFIFNIYLFMYIFFIFENATCSISNMHLIDTQFLKYNLLIFHRVLQVGVVY